MSAADDALLGQIAERRNDKAFMDRIAHRVHEDAALMERLKDGECQSARLVESRDGGAVLVYECECGARLTRTREQAEADAPGEDPDLMDLAQCSGCGEYRSVRALGMAHACHRNEDGSYEEGGTFQ